MEKETARTDTEHPPGRTPEPEAYQRNNTYYRRSLYALVKRIVRPGSRVLHIGCETGELLASLKPSVGMGIDSNPLMIEQAQKKIPSQTFIYSPLEEFSVQEKFDYIILIDVIDHAADIMDVLERVHACCHPATKILVTTINPWWEWLLTLIEKLGGKKSEGLHNFIEKRNLLYMLEYMDFSVSYSGFMLLFPAFFPLLSFLANTIAVRIWGINKLSFVQFMILRPLPKNETDLGLGCSVVIPCHNEAENIAEAVSRIPKMGTVTEIIVVNDGSKDNTAEVVRGLESKYTNLKFIDYSPNRGKGFAVREGFNAATQEVLMILDADMSVPPEELPRFFHLLNNGVCDFVNGTRMIYPMQKKAMRFFNLLGNKLFSLVMAFITNQHFTDTLCGTKALYKKDFQAMAIGFDRWGDFDLLFGAAKMKRKIVEMPIHYMERKAGQTKMKVFRHGLHLARNCLKGFKELVLTP
jgi:hypothetical protein